MYKKSVKLKKKNYTYYYHNIKINGKVKNIFLGKSRKEALIKLNNIKGKKEISNLIPSKEEIIYNELLNNAPSPNYNNNIINLNIQQKIFLFFIITLFTFSLFFNFIGITGFVINQPTNLQSQNNTLIPTLTPTLSWTNSTGGNENNTYILDISNNSDFSNIIYKGRNIFVNYTGTPGLNGGINLISAYSSSFSSNGLTTNGSDFWIVDSNTDYVYHFNSNGNNITGNPGLVGGFNSASAYSSSIVPQGITTNGSDFWIVDSNTDYVYHFNSNGNNITDGYSLIKSYSSGIIPYGIDTNSRLNNLKVPNDFWISDSNSDYVYHFIGAIKEAQNPTSHTLTSNLSENNYYWRVKGFDGLSESGYSYSNFTIDITYPTNISLISPSNNTISTNSTPLLVWGNTTELNFDNYTIQVDDNNDFSSIQFTYLRSGNTTNSSFQVLSPWNSNTRYYWRVLINDKANNQNTSNTFTYTTDNSNPTITLESPSNSSTLTSSPITFNYIPVDGNLQACELHGNFTSNNFALNNTELYPNSSATNKFILGLSDSSYIWNVRCNDTSGNSGFASANFTFTLAVSSGSGSSSSGGSSGGGGGSSGGKSLSFLPDIEVISPNIFKVDSTGSIITLIKIKNTGKTILSGITINATTNTKGLELYLDNNLVNLLNIDEEYTTNLRIITNEFKDEKAEILITAKSANPETTDQSKTLINLKTKVPESEAKAKEQLEFLRNLLKNNPECTNLNETIKKIEDYIKNKKYDELIRIGDYETQNCKNFLISQGKELRLPKKTQLLSDALILAIEGFTFLILTYVIYNYYKKRKFKK